MNSPTGVETSANFYEHTLCVFQNDNSNDGQFCRSPKGHKIASKDDIHKHALSLTFDQPKNKGCLP